MKDKGSDSHESNNVNRDKNGNSGARQKDINVKYRKFPGPEGISSRLRIAFEKKAFADLMAHGKSNLDVEICGVLTGNIFEDEEGMFINVGSIIEGNSAKQGSTHVTFTQETWNDIHERLDKEHAGKKIVGWYHTHPGFGVEFSDMDLFIQKNFFPLSTQVGFLLDPIKGESAVIANIPHSGANAPRDEDSGGQNMISYIDKFWVEGRPVQCFLPQDAPERAKTEQETLSFRRFEILETRFNQFLERTESQKRIAYSALTFAGLLVLFVVLAFIGFQIFNYLRITAKPGPEVSIQPLELRIGNQNLVLDGNLRLVPVTVKVGDKIVSLEILLRGSILSPNGDEKGEK